MHELSLSEGMLRLIEDQAREQGFSRVRKVWLELGELSHAEPEAMRFCFQAVTAGTVADGAELEIVRTAGKAWCMDCSRPVPIAQKFDPCPDCGGFRLELVQGDEMRLKELEVV